MESFNTAALTTPQSEVDYSKHNFSDAVKNVLNWSVSSGVASFALNAGIAMFVGAPVVETGIAGGVLGAGLGAVAGLVQNTYRSIKKVLNK